MNGTAADEKNAKTVSITMPEAIYLALRNNRSIKSAYLDRVIQKYALYVAEAKFRPNINLAGNLDYSKDYTPDSPASETTVSGIGPNVTWDIPTGGQFSFVWVRNDYLAPASVESKYAHGWTVALNQPLLKDGGYDVAMASVRLARIGEDGNILGLKENITSKIVQTISAYRNLLRAERNLEISRQSLTRAEELVEVNKMLINAGRMAAMDLIQTEADQARRRFDYERTLNDLDRSRESLLQILDIDRKTRIETAEKIVFREFDPSLSDCLEIAWANNPRYLRSALDVESSKINLMLAENSKLWKLSVTGKYNNSRDSSAFSWDGGQARGASAGLALNIPLFGRDYLSQQKQYIDARTGLQKSRIYHEQLKDDLEIEIKNAVRDIKSQLVQARLATQTRILSEKKLEVERFKLNLGRSSNFQLVQYENDLTNAQVSELTSIISYLESLDKLDQSLGTTLDTWKVDLRDERNSVDKFEKLETGPTMKKD